MRIWIRCSSSASSSLTLNSVRLGTYMLASVEDNWDEPKDMADYRVYKYFIKEDIARTRKMGIANLPTMCINGEQKYISIIPSKEELIEAVKEAQAKK